MENERLRRAMVRATVTVEDVHKLTGVDEKTVQRWIKGRVPHQRHRWAVAKLVSEDEAYLWPTSEARLDSSAGSTAEVVAAYAHRADAPSSLWTRLIDDARHAVDVLGYAVQFLPELYPALGTRLVAKAGDGCRVRIAVADPDSAEVAARDAEERLDGGIAPRIRSSLRHLDACVRSELTEVRYHRTVMYNSIFRFDDELLYTPHLFGRPGYESPLFHLRRVGQGGVFDNLTQHMDEVWASATPV
ncbi:XRE family transcriptional regulator [Kineococcus sp. SYSU DK018]|uniref:XRE family transcriptional regulator n=1 Tax=Kineococcus sp. SYSU DK018 TaxID=3383139 RepID=UPI003D7E1FA9